MSAIIGDGDPFGRDNSIVDVRRAVLLDTTDVVLIGTADETGAGRAIGLQLAGRINKSSKRSSVLYLFDEDGATAIVAELFGLAARATPTFLETLLARVADLPKPPRDG